MDIIFCHVILSAAKDPPSFRRKTREILRCAQNDKEKKPETQTAASGCGGLLSIRGEREGDEGKSDFDIFNFLASPVHSNTRREKMFQGGFKFL